MSDPDGRITCATYTHARRHPLVLGKIGDWSPPVQLTLPQVGVLIIGFVIEFRTWHLWGSHIPDPFGALLFVLIPCLLAWAVRKARLEGRSAPRAVMGWVAFAARPRAGWAGGRSSRPVPRAGLGSYQVYVAPGDIYEESTG